MTRTYVGRVVTADLAPTIALGVGSALLAFEGFAALRSLVEVRGARPPRPVRPSETSPLLFTPRGAIRAHFVEQRRVVNAIRRQYPTLRSSRHGRELRAAIGRVRRHPVIGDLRVAAPSDRGLARSPRLKEERQVDGRLQLASPGYNLMTPTRKRITRTMTITPTTPTPPLL